MEAIIELLFNIFIAIISILPTSPFLIMIGKIEEVPVLGVVNWFIPFDTCLTLLQAWLVVVIAYYAFKNIRNILDWISKIKSIF